MLKVKYFELHKCDRSLDLCIKQYSEKLKIEMDNLRKVIFLAFQLSCFVILGRLVWLQFQYFLTQFIKIIHSVLEPNKAAVCMRSR